MKDLNLDPKESGVISHFRSMLFRLTGAGLVKGRHRTAIEVWRKIEANRDAIAKKAKERGATKKNGVTIRGQVAKEMFDALDGATKREYTGLAEEENKGLDEIWEKNTKGPLSTTPTDRQRYILLPYLWYLLTHKTAIDVLSAFRG